MRRRVRKAGPRPFRHRDFRLLFAGQSISSVGDWLYSIALVVYIYDATGSPGWVAASTLLRLLPYIFIGPVAGALVDRHDKRSVILISDIARAGVMLAIASVAAVEGPPLLILLLVTVSSTLTTADGPAVGALVPTICEEDELGRANALLGTVENVAMIVGPAFGGLLVLVGSTTTAFALNALTFIVAALCAFSLKRRPREDSGDREQEPMRKQLVAGIRTATGSIAILAVMLFLFLAGVFYGHEVVLVVLIATEKFDVGGEGIGWLNAAAGVGGVAAAGVASKMAAGKRSDLMLGAAVTVGAVPYAVMSATNLFVVGLGCMALLGAAAIAIDVIATTLLQRTVDRELHGRILALVDAVTMSGIFLGSLVAPIAVGTLGLDATLLVIGTAPLLALLVIPRLKSLNAEANEEAAELAPLVALLRTSILFADENLPALEAIARRAERRAVDANEVVVREGEPAADIYVLASGRMLVRARGEGDSDDLVNVLHPGDHFGEVGVLARVPRTATVVAGEPSEVIVLPGSVLLDIVNREPTRSSTIVDASVRRLARTHPRLAAMKNEELAARR